ncbi:hypothetical protein CGZ80_17380 [Rhodopirellula sp. MGV]|nr:hypothetical protein CGZ80_17380 [Rhodopirellula sp. MGV]
MYASSKPIELAAIQDVVPETFDSSVVEKLGGSLKLLTVADDGASFLQVNALDDDSNADTAEDFQGITEPADFVTHAQSGSLHFALFSCNDAKMAEINDIVQRCAAAGILQFDVTRADVVQLDGSSSAAE